MKNINLTFWIAAALSAPFAQAQKYVQCSKELYYFDGYKVGGTGISSVPVKISEVTINKFDDQTLVTDASGLNILEHSTYAVASTGPTPIVEHQVHRHRPTLKLNADEFANIIGMSDQASLGKKSFKYRVKGAQDDTFHFPRDIFCQPANDSCALYIHLPLNWVAEVQGNQIQACRPNQTITNYVPQAFAYSEVAPYLAEMGVKPAANGTMRVFNVDCASFVQGVGCFYDEPIDNADQGVLRMDWQVKLQGNSAEKIGKELSWEALKITAPSLSGSLVGPLDLFCYQTIPGFGDIFGTKDEEECTISSPHFGKRQVKLSQTLIDYLYQLGFTDQTINVSLPNLQCSSAGCSFDYALPL